MALTRKFLSALGIEPDKIDEIITAHTETVDALKNERDTYKENAEKLPGVQAELDGLKAKAAKDDGKDPWKVKYDALKEEFTEYKAEQGKKETAAKKSAAYRELLKECGVREKRIDAVLKVTDLEGVELDENGAIKDAEKLKKDIATEWEDFIDKTSQQGANTATPPNGNGAKTYKNAEEIMAIRDPVARQNAIAENLELFSNS